jgi:hypothetical protein
MYAPMFVMLRLANVLEDTNALLSKPTLVGNQFNITYIKYSAPSRDTKSRVLFTVIAKYGEDFPRKRDVR